MKIDFDALIGSASHADKEAMSAKYEPSLEDVQALWDAIHELRVKINALESQLAKTK